MQRVQAAERAAPGLRIQIVGELRVSIGSHEIEPAAWRRHKARSPIKLIALAPRHRIHRERLVEQLWPELDPRNVAAVVQICRRLDGLPLALALADRELDVDAFGAAWALG